jgi:transcriptional regulator with XRE-family HTH domain
MKSKKKTGLSVRVSQAIERTKEGDIALGQKLGVSKNTITSYRAGNGDPKGSVLAGLVAYYREDPVWLLTGVEGDAPAHPDPNLATLNTLIRYVEKRERASGIRMPPPQKAALICNAYNDALDGMAAESAADKILDVILATEPDAPVQIAAGNAEEYGGGKD